MEMEMDDIPLPEELEWLESNGLLPEEEEDYEFPLPPEEEEEEEEEKGKEQQPQFHPPPPRSSSRPAAHSPSGGLSDNQINNSGNNKKRPWSKSKGDFDSVGDDPLDAKRNRLVPSLPGRGGGGRGTSSVEIDAEEEEDEWLRYSPPPPPPSVPVKVEIVQEKYICRFASDLEGDCFSVTGPSGDRVYAKMITAQLDDTNNSYFATSNKKFTTTGTILDGFETKGLISEPVTVLMERLEQDALIKALQDSSESSDAMIDHQSSVTTENLWVNKYAPNSFTELLSDEQTNREVLLWLKQWDSCVFGSDIRSTTTDVLSALRRHTSLAQQQKLSGMNSFGKNRGSAFPSKAFKHSDNLNQEDNNVKSTQESFYKRSSTTGSGPPDQKVLLLCGPPGLGKTTLAHVAAKHCGYRVVEINASDDRSSATIEAKILDVVQMNSIMADAKPKCLIIDEIDGGLGDGKGAVEVILKMIAAEKKYEAGKENVAQKEQQGKSSSKRGKKTTALSRPIICICNDLFAPSLRPLRQVAKVHIFVKPTINRVVSRLKYICNKEGFRTSSTALTALAVHTECDIRSCLNTLQFLNKKKETLNLLEISSQVGHKDMSKSVFDVWKEVFQKRKPKVDRKSSVSSTSSDFEFLHFLISNCGEYELTMDGIHENILQLHYHDPLMQKTVNSLNILGVSDHLHQYIMRTQQMSLLAYQPSTAIAISRQIAQIKKPNIEWPKSSQRYRTTLLEKKDLLRCWCNRISPSISRHLSTESFVGDDISPLLYILSPPTLRPVALHLLSEREKNDLAQLVDTMVSYSITYKNMNPVTPPSNLRYEAALDAPTLSFDPPIGDFINFKDYTSGHYGLSLPMKQVLVHEVEKQKILSGGMSRSIHSNDGNNTRNHALLREGGKASTKTDMITSSYVENMGVLKNQSTLTKGKDKNSTNSSTSCSNESIAADLDPKAPGVTKKPSGGSCSFFDRFRRIGGKLSSNPDNVMQKQATLERDSRPLIFKFNEGFTNAVKRPVRISELLL